jgi:hypothetical protein
MQAASKAGCAPSSGFDYYNRAASSSAAAAVPDFIFHIIKGKEPHLLGN